MSPLSIAFLVLRLAPDVRAAVAGLARALRDGDGVEARRSYEAARRAAFIARQTHGR